MLDLVAKTRTIFGKSNKCLREKGSIPAVVYGHKVKNQNLELEYMKFEKIFEKAGESSLIDLKVDEAPPIKVLVQDIERDPVSQNIIHVDFHQVREDEEITAAVEINFIGEAPAEKEQGGVLVKNLDAVEIQCLPKDLIHQIDVDLSRLRAIGDSIYVKDLKVPVAVKVLQRKDEPVVSVIEPRSQKELEELEEKPGEGQLPEGAGEKAVEGEKPAAEGAGKREEGREEKSKTKNKKQI